VVLIKGDLSVLKANEKTTYPNDPYDIMSVETYKQLRCNENVGVMQPSGTGMQMKKFNIGKCFMEWDGRKTYDAGLIFEPPPNIVRGRVFNHWRGFNLEPEEGDWSLVRNHIKDIICRGDDANFQYLMTLIAHIFQRPGEKTGAAIVVRGKKGTGKSLIFDVFLNKLLQQYAQTIANRTQIVGQFNAHLFGKLYVCLEEAVWAGDMAGEGVLKHLLTGENITYEFKGMMPFQGSNYTRVAFLSNEEWVVPATYDERRFFIISPSEEKVGDKEYFVKLAEAVADPDVQAAFLYDMLNTEVDDWNVLRFPPNTKWLKEQVIQSTPPEDEFFLDLIRANGSRTGVKDDDLEPFFISDDEGAEHDADLVYQHYRRAMSTAGVGATRRARPYPAFEKKVKKYFGVDIVVTTNTRVRTSTIPFPPMQEVRDRLKKENYPV
jgi:hypothetical protein